MRQERRDRIGQDDLPHIPASTYIEIPYDLFLSMYRDLQHRPSWFSPYPRLSRHQGQLHTPSVRLYRKSAYLDRRGVYNGLALVWCDVKCNKNTWGSRSGAYPLQPILVVGTRLRQTQRLSRILSFVDC
jgi:hypothetical protein